MKFFANHITWVVIKMRVYQLLFLLCLWAPVLNADSSSCAGPITCVDCTSGCDSTQLFACDNDDLFAKTFYSFRPQDSDSARTILGHFHKYYYCNDNDRPFSVSQEYAEMFPDSAQRLMDDYDNNNTLSSWKITAQYNHSFHEDGLARWFFFNGTECMTVGIPDDEQSFDIDGSQIGLSLGNVSTTTLQTGPIGTVSALPEIENIIFDIELYHDLKSLKKGLWVGMNLCIAHMTTDLNLCAQGSGTRTDDFPAGLFTVDCVGETTCQTTPVPYISIIDALEGCKGWGSIVPLSCGKFSTKKLHKFGVAGLHGDLGYDFYKNNHSYCAASVHIVAPTGSRPQGEYLFEPVIGANKSWQLGATLRAHHLIGDADAKLGFYGYVVMTHLFKAQQTRVFSLKDNGPGSQLLLLKKYNAIGSQIEEGQRVANVLCGETKIGSSLMFDGSFLTQFNYQRFFLDLGYNFWLRTREERSNKVCLKGFAENQLGIKGNLPLASVQTIGCPDASPVCTYDLDTAHQSTLAQPAEADSVPLYLQASDINFGSALHPTTWSHKFFGAFAFKWARWMGSVSGSVEFGKKNYAVNQWGIACKVGKDF